jgi:hypothetical protein
VGTGAGGGGRGGGRRRKRAFADYRTLLVQPVSMRSSNCRALAQTGIVTRAYTILVETPQGKERQIV